MRGRLTEQNLTDYALNELPPDERLYTESMLAVSEECRNDVYRMLEVAEMLKEGFEDTGTDRAFELSAEQRAKVLDVPAWNWRGIVKSAAAILLLSVGTAFIVTRPGFWHGSGVTGDRLASAGQAVHGMMADLHQKGFARSVEEFRSRMEMASVAAHDFEWQFASQPAVCTPPAWLDSPLPEAADM
jgi:anti-sigma factor RsiW